MPARDSSTTSGDVYPYSVTVKSVPPSGLDAKVKTWGTSFGIPGGMPTEAGSIAFPSWSANRDVNSKRSSGTIFW